MVTKLSRQKKYHWEVINYTSLLPVVFRAKGVQRGSANCLRSNECRNYGKDTIVDQAPGEKMRHANLSLGMIFCSSSDV